MNEPPFPKEKKMITSSNPTPTLADVRKAIASSNAFPEAKRRRIDNAFRSVWRYSGVRLDEVPATIPALSKLVESIQPAAHNVRRPTIINMRNLVMHGMKHSGFVPSLGAYREPRKALNPSWAVLFSRIESHNEKNSLWSFVHYLNEREIAPADVNDEHFKSFVAHLNETSPRANQYQLTRSCARCWNALQERSPDLLLQRIGIPPSRLRRLPFQLADFPPSFQDHLWQYEAWLISEDIFDDKSKMRAVKPSTATLYVRRVLRAAVLLAESGFERDRVTSLDVLAEPHNLKTIMRALLTADKSAQRVETFATATIVAQMARDWLEKDAAQIQELLAIKAKLPKPQMAMTDKNKKLVSQFDDPAVLQRLIRAPQEIWRRLQKDHRLGHRSRLALAQAALGISILTSMPLRLSNLTELSFGTNILLRPAGTSSLIIPAEGTKAGRAIEFDIPEPLAVMMIEYYECIAPAATNRTPDKLFCRTDGVGKGFAQVRWLIQKYFKEYVGFHMNPHAFRHLCAKLILDAEPGAHVLVQDLLGHKSVETATKFYAGHDSRRAGRHHQQLIAQAIAQQISPQRRRRARRA